MSYPEQLIPPKIELVPALASSTEGAWMTLQLRHNFQATQADDVTTMNVYGSILLAFVV